MAWSARRSAAPAVSVGALLLCALSWACQREKPVAKAAEAPLSSGAGPRSAPASPSAEADGPGAPPKAPAADVPSCPPALCNLPTPPTELRPFGPGVVTGVAVVSSVEKQATSVGMRVLEAGGNAVDAAVAVAFALAVTHPSAGNIGGGGFLLVRLGTVVEAIDFRENAPARLSNEAWAEILEDRARTAKAVGIPGTVAGLYLAHQRHGRLPWGTLLEGAIGLAKKGAEVGPRQALTLGWAKERLRQDPAAKRTFFPSGTVPAAGSRLVQPNLALALERIRDQGPPGFYAGPTADDLIASLGPGGLVTKEDLLAYRAALRTPLTLDYHGARVVTMPPPSGGGVALLSMLAMLDRVQVQATPSGSVARYHLYAEASRRAQVVRQLMIAPPGNDSSETDREERQRWIDADTWLGPHPIDPSHKTASSAIDPRYAQVTEEPDHTTHFSVVDADGGTVSCTVTLSASFGAGIVTQDTGIVLNNAVGSFSKVGANAPRPGVRTLSSMAPTLVFLGERDVLVLGSPGGDTIPSTIAGLVVALVDDRRSLAEAVSAPRMFQGFAPDEISTERQNPLPLAVVAGLERLGHRVRPTRRTIGDANVAAYFAGAAGGVHDAREGGEAKALEHPE